MDICMDISHVFLVEQEHTCLLVEQKTGLLAEQEEMSSCSTRRHVFLVMMHDD